MTVYQFNAVFYLPLSVLCLTPSLISVDFPHLPNSVIDEPHRTTYPQIHFTSYKALLFTLFPPNINNPHRFFLLPISFSEARKYGMESGLTSFLSLQPVYHLFISGGYGKKKS